MSVIDKPGFYTSKAGKCEVVACDKDFAFGYALRHKDVRSVQIWDARNGDALYMPWSQHETYRDWSVTSPYIEPRKPVEAWAITTYSDGIFSFYRTRDAAEKSLQGFCNCRLVHLREVEDEKP